MFSELPHVNPHGRLLMPAYELRVRFFGKIRIRIFNPRSLASWCIKGTNKSLPRVDSSVPLIHHDPSDLGSKIRIRIFPQKRTLIDKLHPLGMGLEFYYASFLF